MASGPITSCQTDAKKVETVTPYLPGLQKLLQMVTVAMKLKELAPWKKTYDSLGQHIKKQIHHFPNKSPYSQSYDFSYSHIWI